MNSLAVAVPILMNLTLGNVPVKFLQKDPHVLVNKVGEQSATIKTPTGSEKITILVGNEKITILPGSEVQISLDKHSQKEGARSVVNVNFSRGRGIVENAPPVPGQARNSTLNSQSVVVLRISTPQGAVPIESTNSLSQLGVKATIIVGSEQSSYTVDKGEVSGPNNKNVSQGQTLIIGKGGTSITDTPPVSDRTPSSVGSSANSSTGTTSSSSSSTSSSTSFSSHFTSEIQPPTAGSESSGSGFAPPSVQVQFETKPTDSSNLSPLVVRPPQSIPNVNQPSGGNAILNVNINTRVN